MALRDSLNRLTESLASDSADQHKLLETVHMTVDAGERQTVELSHQLPSLTRSVEELSRLATSPERGQRRASEKPIVSVATPRSFAKGFWRRAYVSCHAVHLHEHAVTMLGGQPRLHSIASREAEPELWRRTVEIKVSPPGAVRYGCGSQNSNYVPPEGIHDLSDARRRPGHETSTAHKPAVEVVAASFSSFALVLVAQSC